MRWVRVQEHDAATSSSLFDLTETGVQFPWNPHVQRSRCAKVTQTLTILPCAAGLRRLLFTGVTFEARTFHFVRLRLAETGADAWGGWSTGPTYAARGRIKSFMVRCSSPCAIHSTARPSANKPKAAPTGSFKNDGAKPLAQNRPTDARRPMPSFRRSMFARACDKAGCARAVRSGAGRHRDKDGGRNPAGLHRDPGVHAASRQVEHHRVRPKALPRVQWWRHAGFLLC